MASEDQASVKSEDSPGPRLKFLCSYGGRILPRPQDAHLRYVGGETRMVAVNRHITYAEMALKLQNFFGPNLLLKYQLPGEDLDALISVTCDEDVENMIDEYDRNDSREGSSRLRAFLFPLVPSSSYPSARSLSQDFMDEAKSPGRKYVEAVNNGGGGRVVKVPSDPSYDGAFQVPDFLFGLDPTNPQQQSYHRQHRDSEVTSPTYLHSSAIEPPSPNRYRKDTASVAFLAPPVTISQAEYLTHPTTAPPTTHSSPALVPLVPNTAHTWDAKKAWDGGVGDEQRREWREERRSADIANEANYIPSQHLETATEPGLWRISSKDKLALHPLDGSFPETYVVFDQPPPNMQKQPVPASAMLNAERQRPDEIQMDVPGLSEMRQEAALASGGRLQRNVEAHWVAQQAKLGGQLQGYDGTGELPPGSHRNSGDSDLRIEGQVIDNVLNKPPTLTDPQAEGFKYQDTAAHAVEENVILQQPKQPDFEASLPHPSHQIEVPQHMHLGKGHFQQVHWQAHETLDQQQQQQFFDTIHGQNAVATSRILPSHSSHLLPPGVSMHHHRAPSAVVNTGRVPTRVDTLPNTRAPSPLYKQVGNPVLVHAEPQQLTRAISPLRNNPSANGPVPQRYAIRIIQVHEPRVIHPTTVQQPSGFPVSPTFTDFSEPHAIYEQTHYLEKAVKGNNDMGIGQVQYLSKAIASDHDQTLGQGNYVDDNMKANPQYMRGPTFQENYVDDNLKTNPQYSRVTSFQDT